MTHPEAMVALVSNYFIGRSSIGIKLYDSVILHNKSVSNIIHPNMIVQLLDKLCSVLPHTVSFAMCCTFSQNGAFSLSLGRGSAFLAGLHASHSFRVVHDPTVWDFHDL